MRKSLLVAGTATLALGVAGIAYAQTPAPTVEATASVSPSKAGTKSKPKSEKLKLTVKNNPDSKTTASKITVTFPSTLKMSTRGLDQCTASDDELLAGPEQVCKSSIAGSGVADAVLNPYASPSPLHFDVTPVVGKNEMLFYLQQTPGSVRAVLHGKISGRKMTIEIPRFLQTPDGGKTFSALSDLTTTLSKKKGKNYLISSTGCTSKKHAITAQVSYVPNPTPPAATSAKDTADAKCS